MRKDYTQIAKNVLKYKNAVAPLLSFNLLEILFIYDILLLPNSILLQSRPSLILDTLVLLTLSLLSFYLVFNIS